MTNETNKKTNKKNTSKDKSIAQDIGRGNISDDPKEQSTGTSDPGEGDKKQSPSNTSSSSIEHDDVDKKPSKKKKDEGEVKEKAAETFVKIGCKIPMGVQLSIGDQTIVLKGVNAMKANALRPYGGIGYTKLEKVLWDQITKQCQDWPLLKNGAVFLADHKSGGYGGKA